MLKISEQELRAVFVRYQAGKVSASYVIGKLNAFLNGLTPEQERGDRDEKIKQAVRLMHLNRGCCDGLFTVPCTYKEQQEQKGRKPREPSNEYEGTE